MRKALDYTRVNHKVSLREELLRTMEDTGLDEVTVKRLLRDMTHSELRAKFRRLTDRANA